MEAATVAMFTAMDMTYNPTDPVKDADGNWTEHTDKTAYANPVSLLMETHGKNQNTNLRTLGTITYSRQSKGWI